MSKPERVERVDWAGIGRWIGEQRHQQGLSVVEAARRARVAGSTWRKFEAGRHRRPTDETLIRMARAIGVEPAELMARCARRYVDAPTIRPLAPTGAPLDLLEVLESDTRLDPRARRLILELYDVLASRS